MSGKFTQYAERRAKSVAIGFGLWGFFMANIMITDWAALWPLLFFYELLILNTFFSVRTFATITPEGEVDQSVIDLVIGLCFLAMPLVFNSPLYFILIAELLFILCVVKYIYLISAVGFSRLLYRKTLVDVAGALLCFFAFMMAILIGVDVAIKILAIVFFIANIDVLWLRPIYILDMHFDKELN